MLSDFLYCSGGILLRARKVRLPALNLNEQASKNKKR